MTDTQTTPTKNEPVALAKPSAGAALALVGTVRIDSMAQVFMLADSLAQARSFVPRHLAGDANAIAAVILTGIELGMGPMESMREIHIIEGRPTMGANLMLARARRSGIRTRWITTNDKRAEIEVTLKDGVVQSMPFTIEEAARANLTGKNNWKHHTAAMLRARAVSAALRAFCPEVLGGSIYTAEELDPDAAVDEHGGKVIDATPAPQRRDVERLSDARSPNDVLAWCTSNRSKLASVKNGTREKAIVEIRQHAQRVGLDAERALSAAGLTAQEAPPETHAPGTIRFKMGHHEKGAPFADLSDEGLASYRTAVERGLDKPERARWRDDDTKHLAEVDREISRRRGEDGEPEDDARTSGSPDDY